MTKRLLRPEWESNPRDSCFADSRVSTSPSGQLRCSIIDGKLTFVKSIWKIFLILFLGLFLGVGFWGYNLFFRNTKAGLLVDTTPKSRVFINGEEVGQTRFDLTRAPGEITLKLIPISDQELLPFETKLTLAPGVKTVYQRNFSPIAEMSSDILVSYEKSDLGKASISVVTNPKDALLVIDNKRKETSPVKIDDVKEGDHSVLITAKGYRERSINVRNKKGYKLTLACSLAKDGESVEGTPVPVVSPTPSMAPVTNVYILDTPTGFLRVRAEASTLGAEIGQVTPGKPYELVEKDEKTGWYKIKFIDSTGIEKEGWVSNKYTTLATPAPTSSPSPSATPTI